jgi:catechol 2,3-dioxygenase-like lactoylglutathione lyase family enzyme
MNAVTLRQSSRLNHVGITVNDLDRSIKFWVELTGGRPSEPKLVDAPHLSELLGYDKVRLRVATVAVSEALTIELLQYISEPAEPYEPGTAHPGNVHVCFDVDDMAASWRHALRCGATPVGASPVVIPDGPAAGGQLAYLRTVDGACVELRSMPSP